MSAGTGRKFQFIREIASGGFGSVYLAKVIHADGFARLAAIKLLHPKWSENAEIASRMRDEARLLGWLRHKNIVEVLDLTRISGRVAVIMEYLEAVDIKIVIQALAMREREIPLRAALEACAAVAGALDAAFNRPPYAGEKPLRVIHRDIKPSNVMLDGSGTVKVLDFGVARADFDERESRTQEMSFGSLEYMPPERLFFEPDTPKSDVYSLGATLYEMLAMQKLGKAKLRQDEHTAFLEDRWADLRQFRSLPSAEIEADTKALLFAMLAFDADDRPAAADSLVQLRTLARRCPDDALAEWAEVAIPPLVMAFSGRTVEQGPDSLVGQLINEDSRGFAADEESSVGVGRVPASSTMPLSGGEEEDSLDESGRVSDEQWKKLKQATLADLDPAPAPPPAPAPRPAVRAQTMEPRPPPQATPQPVPARAAMAAEWATESEPPPRSGGGFVAIALIFGFAVLVLGAVALIAAVGGAGLLGGASAANAPQKPAILAAPAEAPKPAPKVEPKAAPKVEPPKVEAKVEAPAAKQAKFTSAAPDTKRVTVRCDQGEGDGAIAATVVGDALGDCTVTAIDNNRKRLMAIVKGATPREYTCFEAGAKECR